MAGDGVMGTGIFLLPELQGAQSQSKISRPEIHTKKGCADVEQTSPRNAAPSRAQHSPVSPRSMAGVVRGTGHGRANIRERKSQKKKIKTNHLRSIKTVKLVNDNY